MGGGGTEGAMKGEGEREREDIDQGRQRKWRE